MDWTILTIQSRSLLACHKTYHFDWMLNSILKLICQSVGNKFNRVVGLGEEKTKKGTKFSQMTLIEADARWQGQLPWECWRFYIHYF